MNDVFSYLRGKFTDRRKELMEHLGQGSIKDMTEYSKICGFIQGLEYAEEVTLDLSKRMEDNDDE